LKHPITGVFLCKASQNEIESVELRKLAQERENLRSGRVSSGSALRLLVIGFSDTSIE